jgi:hypothetical protein
MSSVPSFRRVVLLGAIVVVAMFGSLAPVASGAQTAGKTSQSKSAPWRAIRSTVPLDAVSCWRAGACFAVGAAASGSGVEWQTLHSGRWTPGSQSTAFAPLGITQLVCLSAGHCVALGVTKNANIDYYVDALTYNRGRWNSLLPPLPPGVNRGSTTFRSLSCASFAFCVAVGHFITHNHGVGTLHPIMEVLRSGRWSTTRLPMARGATFHNGGALESVSCTADSSCVAVGYYNTDTAGESQGAVLSIAGHHLSAEQAPLPKNADSAGYQTADLYSISCIRTSRCAAVGGFTDKAGLGRVLVLADIRGHWTVRPVRNRGASSGATLTSVSCRPNGNCAAMGVVSQMCGAECAQYPSGAVAAGPLGGTWTSEALPLTADFKSYQTLYLNGITCPAAGPCVGDLNYGDGAVNFNTDFVQYTNGRWRAVLGPLPAGMKTSDYTASSAMPSCPASSWCVDVGEWSARNGASYGNQIDVGRP